MSGGRWNGRLATTWNGSARRVDRGGVGDEHGDVRPATAQVRGPRGVQLHRSTRRAAEASTPVSRPLPAPRSRMRSSRPMQALRTISAARFPLRRKCWLRARGRPAEQRGDPRRNLVGPMSGSLIPGTWPPPAVIRSSPLDGEPQGRRGAADREHTADEAVTPPNGGFHHDRDHRGRGRDGAERLRGSCRQRLAAANVHALFAVSTRTGGGAAHAAARSISQSPRL
jgi:hypothetical protein